MKEEMPLVITALVVSLHAEARPLIDHFRLKPVSFSTFFPIWTSPTLALIISGIGKAKAAAAVGYLAAIYRDKAIQSWLNIGIAGHHLLPIGTPALVHQITDAASKASFFPSFPFSPPCQTHPCLSVDYPVVDYPKEPLCEMEASGFYPIAAKMAPLEMIHLFKVVSDNREHPSSKLTKQRIGELIEENVFHVEMVLEEIGRLATNLLPQKIPFLDSFLQRWHFTACQLEYLKKALRRWHLLFPGQGQVALLHSLRSCKTASSVLALLDQKLTTSSLPI